MAFPILQRGATKSAGWNVAGLSCAFISLLLAVFSLFARHGTSKITVFIPVGVILIAVISCMLWLYRAISSSRRLPVSMRGDSVLDRGFYRAAQESTVSQPPNTQQTPPFSAVEYQLAQAGESLDPVPLYPTSDPAEQEQRVLTPLPPASGLSMEQILYLEFDQPQCKERCFILPKESEPLIECQDRYALDSAKRCYAVGDGVSDSFLPGPWARIITLGFVTQPEAFVDKEAFLWWLDRCAQVWYESVYRYWVPTINEQHHARGESFEDWENEISRGAQTTLIGCNIEPTQSLRTPAFNIHVLAIGDSLCFLFRQDAGEQWKLINSHPLKDPAEFGYRPDTLMTIDRPDMRELSWERRKIDTFSAQHGDLIVLATDTLARWLLTQVQQNTDRWVSLLLNTDEKEFARIIREELHAKRIDEDDDMTMLVIPV